MQRILSLSAFASLALLAPVASAQQPPAVTVTGGKVQGGSLKSGGPVFKGIPFAAPPVGDLRWREPMPLKSWTGTRDATHFGARCMQSGADVSEDCLYINVWTSDWPPKARKPMMLGFTAALGLRANGPALTTLPVLANVGTSGGSITHVAFNGGWTSVFYLVNAGSTLAQFTLSFFDENGIALPVPLFLPQSVTNTTTAALKQTLAPGAMLVVST